MDWRTIILLATAAAASQPAFARTVEVQATAVDLLARCMRTPNQPFPPEARIISPPPSLTHNSDRLATAIMPASGRRLVIFREISNDLSCGIAIYRRVDARTRDNITNLLDRHPGWKRQASTPNPAADAVPVRQLYWVNVLAPGLDGAMMALRQPSASKPTLEVAVRRTLVR